MSHSLSASHLEEICRNVYSEKWLLDSFHKDKKTIIGLLTNKKGEKTDFLIWNKDIESLHWLSAIICSKVNKLVKEIENVENSTNIQKTKHEIKASIALFINDERIKFLVEILDNIEDLDEWSPNLLESIWRNHIREKDSLNTFNLKNEYSEDEKNNVLSLNTWIKSNIRKYSEKDLKWEIDWERIVEELRLKWYEKYANKFNYKNKNENFKKS